MYLSIVILLVGMVSAAPLVDQWATRPTAPRSANRPPNVILILADDLGYGDVEPYPNEILADRVATPNLLRMAQEGMRFTDGYSGQ